MAIDPRININENQVIFRRDGGHKHDGLTSSLIDYTRYSVFDFLPYPIAPPGSPRRRFQDANEISFKSFIVSAIEERVLNPQGIRVQANAITAREIVAGTISANELSSNVVLVNNIIRSSNFDGTFHANGVINSTGTTGWGISYAGSSVFSNTQIRGTVTSTSGRIGPFDITDSSFTSNGYSPRNFMKIENYGDITVSSHPVNGPHLDMIHRTDIVGEYILIQREGVTGRYAVMGSPAGNPNGMEFSLVDNGTQRFLAKTDGTIFASSSISGASLAVTGAITAGDVSCADIICSEISSGPISAIGDIDGERGTFTFTGNTGTIRARRSKIFSDLVGSQRLMTFINTDSNNAVAEIVFNAGGTGASFVNLSDRDYKNILDDQINGLDTINKIKPVVFTWKGHESSEKNYGFIAQDLYDVLPQAVHKGGGFDAETNSTQPWMIDKTEIIPYLVRAIHQLSDKIEELESRLI
jgi:hypothetical protein